MKTRLQITLVAAALALWSTAAPASIKNIENAYESDPAHVVLPAASGGQIIIRECSGCTPVVLRVDAATRYFVGASNPPVTLAALRTAAADGAASRLLTVFYSLETGIVTRIVLSAA